MPRIPRTVTGLVGCIIGCFVIAVMGAWLTAPPGAFLLLAGAYECILVLGLIILCTQRIV